MSSIYLSLLLQAAIDRLTGSIGEMRTEELKQMMTAISALDSKVTDLVTLEGKVYSEAAKGPTTHDVRFLSKSFSATDFRPSFFFSALGAQGT